MNANLQANASVQVTVGKPAAEHGLAVHDLIARCPPLDRNSLYCNLLQCSHFRNTCAVAEAGSDVIGFVSGYLLPEAPDCLFIWQVAVGEEARGLGLAKKLILNILSRPELREVRYLRTSITARNTASWAMFHGLARQLDAETAEQPLFDSDRHFGGRNETEHELTIGPFRAGPDLQTIEKTDQAS